RNQQRWGQLPPLPSNGQPTLILGGWRPNAAGSRVLTEGVGVNVSVTSGNGDYAFGMGHYGFSPLGIARLVGDLRLLLVCILTKRVGKPPESGRKRPTAK